MSNVPVTPARWDYLRRFTDARIALGRAGHSLPTQSHLDFQLAHAQARDAVHLPFDVHGTVASLQALGCEALLLHSAAADRGTYLQRPDLGRRLDDASRRTLAEWRESFGGAGTAGAKAHAANADGCDFDLAFVVADGLSALAIHRNAVPLMQAVLDRLHSDTTPWTIAPIAVVEQGRVAVGDEVGEALRARTVVVLIGERPGLSSPDSLGLYLTWAPRVGLRDDSRNCISNVRPAGLQPPLAAAKLHQLLLQARARRLTGVGLKDDTDDADPALAAGASDNFLLAGPDQPV